MQGFQEAAEVTSDPPSDLLSHDGRNTCDSWADRGLVGLGQVLRNPALVGIVALVLGHRTVGLRPYHAAVGWIPFSIFHLEGHADAGFSLDATSKPLLHANCLVSDSINVVFVMC